MGELFLNCSLRSRISNLLKSFQISLCLNSKGRCCTNKGLKVVIASNKVCFSIDFYHSSFCLGAGYSDKSFCRDSSRFLCSRRQTLCSKPVYSSFKLSFCFCESFFTIH